MKQDFVVCKCLGSQDTSNCQMRDLRDSSCIKCPEFARGGGAMPLAAGIDSHIIARARFNSASLFVVSVVN